MKFNTISKKLLLTTTLAALVIIINISVAYAQTPSQDVGGLISSLFTNPGSLITFVIEFALGFGLGYFSTKVLKYILALVAIFAIGVIMNVWQSPQIENTLKNLGYTGLSSIWTNQVYPLLLSIMYTLGLTTVLPITIGFIIGLVIASIK